MSPGTCIRLHEPAVSRDADAGPMVPWPMNLAGKLISAAQLGPSPTYRIRRECGRSGTGKVASEKFSSSLLMAGIIVGSAIKRGETQNWLYVDRLPRRVISGVAFRPKW